MRQINGWSSNHFSFVLSVIIVAYKSSAELGAAVAALQVQSQPVEEIIVIDNGAPDGEPVRTSTDLRGARIDQPPRNLGYGAGCNLGVQISSGEDLLLLNADVVLSPDACAAMRRRLHSDSRIAVVGPRIYSGAEIQLSARAFPSLRTGLLGRQSALTSLLARAGRYPTALKNSHGTGGPVDWVSGACMLIRRSAFAEVGGFDDNYWMYWEDADLCRRLSDRGWQTYFEPAAVVRHVTGASGTSEKTIIAFHESAARLATTHIIHTRIGRALAHLVLMARSKLVLRKFHASRGPR